MLLGCYSAQSATTKSKRRKKTQAQMLRDIFKAVLAEKLVELIMVWCGLGEGPATLKACSCAPGCV